MNILSSIALSLGTVALLAACGGTKNQGAAVAPSAGEFDPATGEWKPLTRVVAAPPPQGGAVIADEKKSGTMKKIGDTMKKPLAWVGLGKKDAPSAATTGTTATTAPAPAPTPAKVKPQAAPQPASAEPAPEKPSTMKKIGDTMKKPLEWIGLGKKKSPPTPAPTP